MKMYGTGELVKLGRLLGYEIQPAKGKSRFRIVGEGVYTKKQVIRIVVHMEDHNWRGYEQRN